METLFVPDIGKDRMKKQMIDQHGRIIKKLRLNLLDACNMRCLYCMPEDQKFSKINDLLSPESMANIVSNLIDEGIEEVRLTGGEPLLHPHFRKIVEALSPLPLKKLALTTNAILLNRELDFLKEHGIKHINISLDSLKENTFQYITKSDQLSQILQTIEKAKTLDFNLKINNVLLKNINFEEIEDFLNFAHHHDIEVRFLELMRIGHARQYFDRHFVSADEAIQKLSKNWKLESLKMPNDSTSFNFIAINSQTNQTSRIGFIASESRPFCQGCSRLRLSNKGQLRPCIMINEGPQLTNTPKIEYTATISELINKKPIERLYGTTHQMNEIGG